MGLMINATAKRGLFALLPLLTTTIIAAEPPKPHNVLLFVADGLRPGMINEQTAPTMVALMKRGITFTNTHSVFPTFTTPNAAAIATGHMPGDTGDFSNTIYSGFPVPGAGNSLTPFLESDPVLGDIDEHFAGNYLNEETILRAAAAANISTATIGKLGPSLILDHTDRAAQQTIIVDDQTGHPNGIPLSSEMLTAFHEFGIPEEAPSRDDNGRSGDATHPGTLTANVAQQKWFADVAALAALPMFKERHKPFLMVFWSRDPDGTQHNQGDSLLRLVPGINGRTSLAAIKNADANLARLLNALKELGLATTTDVILTSDHGFSTISKESATSYAATRSYQNVPPAMLPPGFVAIDLAHGLRMSLFDPDAPAEAKDTAVPDGSFPVRGNGLIGDDAASPEVVVAANGGSDLIYLPTPDKLTAARIVQILSAQDYVSGIFVDSRLGTNRRHAAAFGGGARGFSTDPNARHRGEFPFLLRRLRRSHCLWSGGSGYRPATGPRHARQLQPSRHPEHDGGSGSELQGRIRGHSARQYGRSRQNGRRFARD